MKIKANRIFFVFFSILIISGCKKQTKIEPKQEKNFQTLSFS